MKGFLQIKNKLPSLERNWRPVLFFIVLSGALLRFHNLDALPLTGDEAYYFLWSGRLDTGYNDHPPLIACAIRLSTTLFGESEAGIRAISAVAGTASIMVAFMLGKSLYSIKEGIFAAFLLSFGPPFIIISRFSLMDSFLVFFLLINILSFIKILAGKDYFLWFSLSFGLLLLTRHDSFLYLFALFLYIALYERKLLRVRKFLFSIAAAILMFSPVIFWNLEHDFSSFLWQYNHLLYGTGISLNTNLPEKIQRTANFFSPPLLLILAVFLLHSLKGSKFFSVVFPVLLFPFAVSGAFNPRYISPAIALLLIWSTVYMAKSRRLFLFPLFFLVLLWGGGTYFYLQHDTILPHSDAGNFIAGTVGWREFGKDFASYAGKASDVYTVPYSYAPLLEYYSGIHTFTNWYQYEVWGIPEFNELIIVSDSPIERNKFEGFFEKVEGPEVIERRERGFSQSMYVWKVGGLKTGKKEFMNTFDTFYYFKEAHGIK